MASEKFVSVLLLTCLMAMAFEQIQAQYYYGSYYYPSYYYGGYSGYLYGKRSVGNYERPNAMRTSDSRGNDMRVQPIANTAYGGDYYQQTSNNNRAYP